MSYIENPEAVGDPNQIPRVHLSPAMVRLFNPCQEQASHGKCGGVNGFHTEGCPKALGPCPTCGGAGGIYGEGCTDCLGTGEMPR